MLAIAGHLGGVPELYGLAPGSGVALYAAFGLLLLATGIMAATHEAALVPLLLSDEPGTVLLRRLLPFALVLPILFTVGSVQAGRRDLLETEMPVPVREAESALFEYGEWLGEVTRKTREGATLRIATHWILHRDPVGLPDAIIEVDDDVTEQRMAEILVRGSEARYRALVAATAQIVWSMAADGREAG